MSPWLQDQILTVTLSYEKIKEMGDGINLNPI